MPHSYSDSLDDELAGLDQSALGPPTLAGFRNSSLSGYSNVSSIPGLSRSNSEVPSETGSIDGIYTAVPYASPPLAASERFQSYLPQDSADVGAFSAVRPNAYDPERSIGSDDSPYGRPEKDMMREQDARSLWARKKKWFLGAGLALIVVVVVAAAVPTSLHKSSSSSTTDKVITAVASESSTSSASSTVAAASASAAASAATVSTALFGGAGSTVILADGSAGFSYVNSFGGYWGYDASNPFSLNTAGRAQSWSPAMNETFRFGVDKIRGVNIGGWLNTEPFISPALYEKYYNTTIRAKDEWTLSEAMGSNLTAEMTEHYETFITEQDFMEIAAAGFNFVRIAIGYWAIETYDGEPFLERVSWTYFLKAIEWARKYGLRINLDLHALPGSQNGWNHSGRLNWINVMHGEMGIANAQRSLNYIRTLTQFISQDQYKDVVPMFGVMNEPFGPTIGSGPLESFYTEIYDMIRGMTGLGAGNGPWVSFHNGFISLSNWAGFLEGSDRVALDLHPYFAFDSPPHSAGLSGLASSACSSWGAQINASNAAFGFTHAGEFSFAPNDCGEWLNGVDLGTRWEGTYTGSSTVYGSCSDWVDYANFNETMKDNLKEFVLASMDALQDYFFWTWKVGNSSITGTVPNPLWSYQLAIAEGYAPTDPRDSVGACAALGKSSLFDGVYSAWMTGGTGAGETVSIRSPWPPTTLNNLAYSVTALPQFTMTGTPITMPAPTYTSPGSTSTFNAGNGWAYANDTGYAYAKVTGCTYPDPWTDENLTPTGTTCGQGAIATGLIRREAAPSKPTTPPSWP